MSGQQGPGNVSVINSITQFLNASGATWNSITIPIPAGMVVYASDTQAVKMGDGATLYAQLPTLFTFSQITSLASQQTTILAQNATITTNIAALNATVNALTSANFTTPTITGGSANAFTIGSVTPASGKFTTVNATGNFLQNGNPVLGVGLSAPDSTKSTGITFMLANAVDHSLLNYSSRQNQVYTVLSPSGNTSNAWHNMFSTVEVNGPGICTGEVKSTHAALIVNAGASIQGGCEPFESRIDNSGAIGTVWGHIAMLNNLAGGTISTGKGIESVFTNLNTTPGSIGNYIFLSMSVLTSGSTMIGGGAIPTNFYFMQCLDPNAKSATAGKFAVGSVGTGLAQFQLTGIDSLHSSAALDIINSSAVHLLKMQNDGSCVTSGGWTFGSTVTAEAYLIVGGTVPVPTAQSGMGTGGTITCSGAGNAHTVTITTGATGLAANAIVALITMSSVGTPTGPLPTIQAGNAAAAGIMGQIWGAISNAHVYTINTVAALAASTTYVFNVHVDYT